MVKEFLPRSLSAWFQAGILLFGTLEASAQSLPKALDDQIPVYLGTTNLVVPETDFLGNDQVPTGSVWSIVAGPRHGTLTTQGTDLIYSPSLEFWHLGLDTAVYTLDSAGGHSSTATIHFHIGQEYAVVYEEGFELPESIQSVQVAGGATANRSGAGAIAGNWGISLSVQSTSRAWEPGDEEEPPDQPPGNHDGGGAEALLDDSEGRTLDLGVAVVLIGDDPSGSNQGRIQLVHHADRTVTAEVWDEGLGQFLSTPALPLVSLRPKVKIFWTRVADHYWVWAHADGAVAGPAVGYNPTLIQDDVVFGAFPKGPMDPTTFHLDGLKIYRSQLPIAQAVPYLRSENFESGVFSGQDLVVGSGTSITSTAVTGDHALEIDVGPGNHLLRHAWPVATESLAVTFRVDASGLTMGSGEMFTFFAAGSEVSNFSSPAMRLYLSMAGGNVRVAAHAYDDGGTPTSISWQTVPDQFEVTVRLETSTSDALGNGYFQLWLDGQLAQIFHLPNGTRKPRWSQVGCQGVDPQTSGLLHFDDLVLWN